MTKGSWKYFRSLFWNRKYGHCLKSKGRTGDDHAAKGSDQGVYQLRTLIPKTVIFRVEEEIARQLFPNLQYHDQNSGKISAVRPVQPKEPAGTYQESILLELKE